MSQSVSRSVVVAAPPEPIFELLAHPERHAEIDGSGTVRGAAGSGNRLELGSRFGMRMRMGLPYRIRNQVVEFEEGRRIAWRHWYRHVWRWELEPVEGGTRVTETFEWGRSRSPRGLEKMGSPERNAKSIEASLENLLERFGSTAGDAAT